MVRLIPNVPNFASSAERDVWNSLKDSLGVNDVMLANLRITDGQGDHEGDIVVGLADEGIAVIEVKGGRVEHNGTDWIQHGATSRRIAPVDQSRRMKYALRTYLNSQERWGKRQVRLAHLVAFPYSTIPREFSLPDCPRSMILDKNDLAGDAVSRLREGVSSQDVEAAAPGSESVLAMVEALSPNTSSWTGLSTPEQTSRRAVWWVLVALILVLVALVAMLVAVSRRPAGASSASASAASRFRSSSSVEAARDTSINYCESRSDELGLSQVENVWSTASYSWGSWPECVRGRSVWAGVA